MEQISSFLHTNLYGLIVGAIATMLLTAAYRLVVRLLNFARKYGLKQLLEVIKNASLHIAAYPKIKADAVLTTSYLSNHLAAMLVDGVVGTALFVAAFSGIWEPLWVRGALFAAALLFVYRLLRKRFGVFAFFSVTAGQAIEEVKASNPVLKNWYNIKEKKPFFQFGSSTSTTASSTSPEARAELPVAVAESFQSIKSVGKNEHN
jgi:hypothetical protein